MKNIRNEICTWIQVSALILSGINIWKSEMPRSIYMLVLILVIEFVYKDRKDD
jgi:hypothetical protein